MLLPESGLFINIYAAAPSEESFYIFASNVDLTYYGECSEYLM